MDTWQKLKREDIRGQVAAEFAEAMAIHEALSWIKQKTWELVVLESDCLAVIQAIRSSISMLSPFDQVIQRCRSELSNMNKVSLYFIKRSANKVARHFAKVSYKFLNRAFDSNFVPVNLMDCIKSELVLE